MFPDFILNKLSENQRTVMAAWQNIQEAEQDISKMHVDTQKEISAEFRGYLIQLASIAAAILALVGSFGKLRGQMALIGFISLASCVVIGALYALVTVQKSAIGIQKSYNHQMKKIARARAGFENYLEKGERTEKAYHEAFKPQVEVYNETKAELKTTTMLPDNIVTLVIILFTIGVVLLTFSFIDEKWAA